MKKYILMLFSSVCVSCMSVFDLKLDDEPVICLESFPGVEDVVVFSLRPAYSMSNSPTKPEFRPEIVFTVNGETVPVVQNTDFCVRGEYPEDCYIADYKPVPGDRMSIRVSSEGFRPISARTSIPEPFPDRKIDYRSEVVGEREYCILYVTFEDDASTDFTYGMQVHNELLTHFTEGKKEITYVRYAGEQIADDYNIAPMSLDGIRLCFDGWRMSDYANVACWSDDNFNGRQKTISMTVRAYQYDEISAYDSFFVREYERELYDEEYNVVGKCNVQERNKLILYTMTDEFYKYSLAKESARENAGFFAGIAPSNFCYSNVEGGYGVFAGVYCEHTDWITPEFIENNR